MDTEGRDWEKLGQAAALAFRIHADQVRKGTAIPYLSHLMAVSAIVLEHGGDQDQACAALLHDAIEDGGVEWESVIEDQLGARVAAIVRACTDADLKPKPPWRARKEAYLAHLENEGPDVLLVSAADKLHNARSIVADVRQEGTSVFDRFNAGRVETLWYYRSLAEIFALRLPGRLASELEQTVGEMHSSQ